MGRFGDWQKGPLKESLRYEVVYRARGVISSITVVSKGGKEMVKERVMERIQKQDPLAKIIDIKSESLIINPYQVN